MKHIYEVGDELDILDVKACVDICLIEKFSHLGYNNSVRFDNNVYRFIYGDTKSPSEKTNTLNFRYRDVSDYYSLCEKYNTNSLEAVIFDLKDCYTSYVCEKGIPRYGNKEITEEVFNDALNTIRSRLIKLVFKLFANETVYTLFSRTPIGIDGIQSQTDARSGNSFNDFFETNLSAYRDYLIRKKATVVSNNNIYIDTQGLFFHTFGQFFFEEYDRGYKNQNRYSLGESSNIVTSKGEMDAAARRLIEEKSSTIPDISLTNLFIKCRRLDSDVFVNFSNKSNGKIFYSIFEWYTEFKLLSSLPKFLLAKQTKKGEKKKFENYVNSFTDLVLVGNTEIPIKDNLQYRIACCRDILEILYTQWYSSDRSNVTAEMINNLCSMSDSHFNNGTHGEELFKTLFCPGKISQTGNNADCHYVNINRYKANNMQINSVKPIDTKVVSYFTNKHVTCLISDLGGDNEAKYIITPAGLERIRVIMDIFYDLDNLYNQLTKLDISMTELLPAYYSGESCTIKGALEFMFRDIYRGNTISNCKIFSKDNLLSTFLNNPNENPWVFDWSLPKLNSINDITEDRIDIGFDDTYRKLSGLGPKTYYMYHEASIFCILSMSFPMSFRDMDKFICFSPSIYDTVQSLGTENGTDYDKLWHVQKCERLCDESVSTNLDSIEELLDTDYMNSLFNSTEETSLFNDDDENLMTDYVNPFEEIEEESGSGSSIDLYSIDLRSEFIANTSVRNIYTTICLLSLLVREFSIYRTNSYASQYINIFKGKGSKITHLNLCDYFDDYPRVFNLISMIPNTLFRVLTSVRNITMQGISPTGAPSIEKFLVGLANMLIDTDIDSPFNILCLMEEDLSAVCDRLLSIKNKIKCVYVENNNYMPVFMDIDTVIIGEYIYHISYKDFTLTATLDHNSYKIETTVPTNISIKCDAKLWCGLSNCDSFSEFVKQCANDGAYDYIKRWEANASALIKKLCSEINDSWKPVIFNVTNTWEIISRLFSYNHNLDEESRHRMECTEINVHPSDIIQRDVISGYTRWYWKNSYYYRYKLPNWEYMSDNENIYGYESSNLNQDGNLREEKDESIEYLVGMRYDIDGGREVVYRKINSYPVMDYLSLWNCSKRILENYSDIHRLSYAFKLLPSFGTDSVSINYTQYVYKTLADLYMNNDVQFNYTRLHKLNKVALALSEAYPDVMSPSYRSIFLNSSSSERDAWNKIYEKIESAMSDDSVIVMKPVVFNRCDTEESLTSMRFQIDIINKFFAGATISNGANMLPTSLVDPKGSINMFVEFLHSFHESIELFKINHIKSVNDNDELSKSYFYHNIESIRKFLKEHSMEVDANMIGNYSQKRKLYGERFYINRNFEIYDDTSLLIRKDGVPYYKVKRGFSIKGRQVDLIAFLHAYSFWIAMELDNTSNMFLINYEVL